VSEDREACGVDSDSLRHVDVDVAEEEEGGDRGPVARDLRLAEVEVDVGEAGEHHAEARQPQPATADDVREETDRRAHRAPACRPRPRGGQGRARRLEITGRARAVGELDPFGELLEREPPQHQMLP
jgi:hypothetical protein